ncbi:MAG: Threonine synthase, partial [Friedmanniella sp.]|nr:Threonine synthase [Friedmanniella sp.]
MNDVDQQPQAPVATRRRPSRGLIARYREWLPLAEDDPVISLGEGSTPLVEAEALSELLGSDVWVKVEGANPTGSFKDRGMTVAVSVSAREGAQAVVCASTGNTSASAAAYAAKAGMLPIVLLPAGRIATGKLAQAIVHGAKVVQIDGNFDQCLELARALADSYPVALVNSVNPMRLEGQKTAAFEVVDDLGDAPDLHVMPVGNAGNISAYWRGYTQYAAAGRATHTPRMWG